MMKRMLKMFLYSSSDYTNFECTDDLRDWDPLIEKLRVYMVTMKVCKNPLYDEPSPMCEVINDDPYWCWSNLLFVENLECLESTTCEYIIYGTNETTRNEDFPYTKVFDSILEESHFDSTTTESHERCNGISTGEVSHSRVNE